MMREALDNALDRLRKAGFAFQQHEDGSQVRIFGGKHAQEVAPGIVGYNDHFSIRQVEGMWKCWTMPVGTIEVEFESRWLDAVVQDVIDIYADNDCFAEDTSVQDAVISRLDREGLAAMFNQWGLVLANDKFAIIRQGKFYITVIPQPSYRQAILPPTRDLEQVANSLIDFFKTTMQ